MPLTWSSPEREAAFAQWLHGIANTHQLVASSARFAAADADFRRYLRVDTVDGGSRIIMDAPPDKMRCDAYVRCAELVTQAGLKGPKVLHWSPDVGFMLLTDLGEHTLMTALDPEAATAPLEHYLQAVDVLVQWQLASKPDVLPAYDAALLRRELDLFPQWYVQAHKGITLNDAQTQTLHTAFDAIISNNLASPSVYVHRDFMPRNLMLPRASDADQRLGVLDFQDAVYGPITYDIASLMRDAFISWDEAFCLDVTIRYWEKARRAGLPVPVDFGDFYRSVEWMGVQRHLKVAGIFARLTLRDGKPKYLADTPRFIQYLHSACSRYRELRPLARLIEHIEGVQGQDVFVIGR